MKIHVEFVYPPIPLRDFDYVAYDWDTAPDGPHGYGRTEDQAIESFLNMLDESQERGDEHE